MGGNGTINLSNPKQKKTLDYDISKNATAKAVHKSYKSSGLIQSYKNFGGGNVNGAQDVSRTTNCAGGTTTTKASTLQAAVSGENGLMIKDSVFTPGSLFRGTFMNNYDSMGSGLKK